jgi:hypothetical protein
MTKQVYICRCDLGPKKEGGVDHIIDTYIEELCTNGYRILYSSLVAT